MEQDPFSQVDKVVNDPLRFKAKLAIGEDAYKSLLIAKEIRKYWDLLGALGGGAAVASSPLVATTFFAPHGVMAFLGLATAATPIGWVIAAAALSGGVWYGVMRVYGNAANDRVIVIPKFINTPLDVLAVSLFDLMVPLSLKVAAADGHIHEKERECIREYFINEWGYDRQYVEIACALIEQRLEEDSVAAVAERLAEFQNASPDCNYASMSKDMVKLLHAIMESDDEIDEREELAIKEVELTFAKIGQPFASRVAGALNEFKENYIANSKGIRPL